MGSIEPLEYTLRVIAGADNRIDLLICQPQFEYKTIEGILQESPLILNIPSHGVPEGGWPVWIEGAQGSPSLNRDKRLPNTSYNGYHINTDSLELNDIGFGPQGFKGGVLAYNPPMALTGAFAEMQIGDLILTSDNGGLEIGNGVITIVIDETQSETLGFSSANYWLEVTIGGDTQRYIYGTAEVIPK